MDRWAAFRKIRNGVVFVVILFLLVVVYFKNNKISNLKEKLDKKPKIEYVYNDRIDTVISIPDPVQIIKWKEKITTKDSLIYIPANISSDDSAKIAKAYNDLYSKYAEIKIYDDILKDDTVAFARVKEKVQFNSVFDRQFIYQHKAPTVVRVTNYETDKTFSIVGGLDWDVNGISLGAGAVTGKNVVYIGKYDPFNNVFGASVFLPIFNF